MMWGAGHALTITADPCVWMGLLMPWYVCYTRFAPGQSRIAVAGQASARYSRPRNKHMRAVGHGVAGPHVCGAGTALAEEAQ